MTLNISDPNNYLDKEIESKLDHIVNYVLENESQSKSEINLMICCEQEMTKLNKNFRNIDDATNILAFESPNENHIFQTKELGDLAICYPLVAKEAKKQFKTKNDHLCHLLVHGVLHILGLDHKVDKDRLIMEDAEINYLKKFNIQNPYIIK